MHAPANQRYLTLDALRGLAAICVMLTHFHLFAPVFVRGGYLAVDLFFAISGFVIARAYGPRFRSGLSPRQFFRRRLVRLYPMCFLGALLGVVLHGGGINTLMLVPSLASPQSLYPTNPALWSLAFELLINVAFALVALSLGIRRLIAILAVSGAWLAFGIVGHGSADVLGGQWATVLYGFPRTAFSFGLGVLICQIQQRHPPVLRETQAAWAVPLLAIALLSWPTEARVMFELFCIFVAFPALVWLGTVWQLPAPKAASALGDMSYPLYCIHMPLIGWFSAEAKATVSLYLAVIALAWALDRWIDPVARRLMDRAIRARAAANAARTASLARP